MTRFILSELDLHMGQFKVFTTGNGNRVLCVHDRKWHNAYYGWYTSLAVLS